jgi:hypothetical protein
MSPRTALRQRRETAFIVSVNNRGSNKMPKQFGDPEMIFESNQGCPLHIRAPIGHLDINFLQPASRGTMQIETSTIFSENFYLIS